MRFFKDLAIGDTFTEKTQGCGIRRNITSAMTYQKINKSTAKVIGVSGDFQPRFIGSTSKYAPFSRVL